MKAIGWCDDVLHIEGVSAEQLAEQFGTPLFVYSRASIESAWQRYSHALAGRRHLICYAVKANSNLAVLDVLARLGSGFDIVSEGELKRVLAAGGSPDRIVFSGVGKSRHELVSALAAGIRCFNVESMAELVRLADTARVEGVVAPVSLRINPDVDAQTHPYISTGLKENKFGIGMPDALATYEHAASLDSLSVQGIDCHIGSQLKSVEPYRDAFERLVELIDALAGRGIALQHIDVGGGQGIAYEQDEALEVDAWANALLQTLGERELEILLEPGRSIVGPAGVLLTRVEYLKSNGERHFAVVDAAMNDLIRPALYDAWQGIETVRRKPDGDAGDTAVYDVVGPVCESADFLGKHRRLALSDDELLSIMDCGAYAAVMSSNYNTRPRAAEVLVDGDEAHLARAREETESLFAREYLLP